MAGWVEPEFELVDLDDERLNRRVGRILQARKASPGASIPGACRSKGEIDATYRFYANEKVTPEGILAPHVKALERRALDFDTIVVAQDTTEIDLTRPKERPAGPINASDRRGLLDHVLLACDRHGLPLGVLSSTLWHRPEITSGKRKRNESRPIEEKESFRWVKGFQEICDFRQRLQKPTRVVMVADSECDIYEVLAMPQLGDGPCANFVIRGCQNRSLPNEDEKLFDAVALTPVLGTYGLNVRGRPAASFDDRKRKQARRARSTTVAIRAARVRLATPRGRSHLPNAEVNAVLIREEKAPEGEEPIEWLLLTDLPIDTPEQIYDVISFYLCRWTIEVYFRVLKGGCRIEDLQLETVHALKNCITLYSVVAWRLHYLTRLGDAFPDLPCDVIFDEDEWQAAYAMTRQKEPPTKPPTLKEMMRIVASLGGFHAQAKLARPGVQAMWIGLARLKDIAFGWRLAKHSR